MVTDGGGGKTELRNSMRLAESDTQLAEYLVGEFPNLGNRDMGVMLGFALGKRAQKF